MKFFLPLILFLFVIPCKSQAFAPNKKDFSNIRGFYIFENDDYYFMFDFKASKGDSLFGLTFHTLKDSAGNKCKTDSCKQKIKLDGKWKFNKGKIIITAISATKQIKGQELTNDLLNSEWEVKRKGISSNKKILGCNLKFRKLYGSNIHFMSM